MNLPEYDTEIRLARSTLESIDDLFKNRDTIDAWMHDRMIDLLRPIINAYPDAHWLTIGDGGADGWMLQQRGAKIVTASSISDVRLQKAKELGHLRGIDVCALNAEQLDVPDASFDVILCSHAFHHVRRAPLAFYEFMRVSRVGFVLIEPIEGTLRLFDFLRATAKIVLRRRPPSYDLFEPAGNYIYRLSTRDIFRMLTAVQMPWFAIKTFNNFYVPLLARQSRDSLLARACFKIGVGVQDILSRQAV